MSDSGAAGAVAVPEPVVIPEPVDWGTARRVARIVAGRDALADSYLGSSLDDDFADFTARSEVLVGEFTGLRAPAPVTAIVLDRKGWVDANVESMRQLLAPLLDRVGERMASSPIAPIGRQLAGSEIGALLGYLSQRVIGQYDLLVPDQPGGDAVYYVGPNVLALEKRFAFRPRDFRMWIALHETTHRAQFTGVPWLRDHFFSLAHQAMSVVEPDPRSVVRALSNAVDELRRGRNPLDEGGLVGLFASPEQRGVLAQVQALMSLLEGHGDYVMSDLGVKHVAGEERMARVLHQRRNSVGFTGFMHKLLGLEQKLRQYEVGEKFIRGVVELGGPSAIDHAWRGPENLPTIDELTAPQAWLQRVEHAPAAH